MKKVIKLIIKILIGIIILWIIIFGIDFYRCSHLKEPIFVLSRLYKDMLYSDGSDIFTCYCLGYRVNLSTIPTSANKRQVTWIEMFIFDKCIVQERIQTNEDSTNSNNNVKIESYENMKDIEVVTNMIKW